MHDPLMSEAVPSESTLFQPRARLSDLATSHDAAIQSTHAVNKAVDIVEGIMRDGEARTDEAIYAAVCAMGHDWSDDITRHARLALQRAGRIRNSGNRGKTKRGASAVLWVWGREQRLRTGD